MFTRGLRGRGMGRLGEFVNRNWKDENWLTAAPSVPSTIIPGVSNQTAAVAGGVGAAALAALAAWWFLKK